MNIYLCDHKLSSSGWNRALEKGGLKFTSSGDRTEILKDVGLPIVVFLHTEQAPVREGWIKLLNGGTITALILINSGGRTQLPANVGANVHACWWNPTEFQAQPRPLEFVRQLASNCAEIDWGLLKPDPVEPILAARLIIEARRHEGQSLHGFLIQPVSETLFQAAKKVEEVVQTEPNNTHCLQTAMNAFEEILGQTTATP